MNRAVKTCEVPSDLQCLMEGSEDENGQMSIFRKNDKEHTKFDVISKTLNELQTGKTKRES